MRIGLVGAMANAMYCLARVLRQQGYDAYYVEDEQDSYPMSQPVWEEVPLTLDWRRFGPEPLDAQGWRALENDYGWRPPSWVVRPGRSRVSMRIRRAQSALRSRRLGAPALLWGVRTTEPLMRELASEPLLPRLASERLVGQLASYDLLVVCGHRIVEAMLSGRPYVFWPHGGDVHIVPFSDETPRDRVYARLTRAAVARAALAGTHDPTIAARLEELGRSTPIPYLPFVVDVDRYSPGEPTTDLAAGIREAAGDRRILLLASRQDFYWKGTDRFARAFAATVSTGAPLYLVVSPWGTDVDATRQIFAAAEVLGSVHYLESAVSKALLRDLYRIADVVVDQFTVTAFGAIMLEAMACGTAVVINLDLDAFRARWPGFAPPPTLAASSEEEIAVVLRAIADGGTDVAEVGQASRSWVEEHHGPQTARLYVGEAA